MTLPRLNQLTSRTCANKACGGKFIPKYKNKLCCCQECAQAYAVETKQSGERISKYEQLWNECTQGLKYPGDEYFKQQRNNEEIVSDSSSQKL